MYCLESALSLTIHILSCRPTGWYRESENAQSGIMGVIFVTISEHCPAYFCALYPVNFNNIVIKSRTMITILSKTLVIKVGLYLQSY